MAGNFPAPPGHGQVRDAQETIAEIAVDLYEELQDGGNIGPANDDHPYTGRWRWDAEHRTGYVACFRPVVLLDHGTVDDVVVRGRRALAILDRELPGRAEYCFSVRYYELGKDRVGSGVEVHARSRTVAFYTSFGATDRTVSESEAAQNLAEELLSMVDFENGAVICDSVTAKKVRFKSEEETKRWRARRDKRARSRK